MVGRTVGKYRILEQIGRGGMGTVFKALDETLDRIVAIKVLNADLLSQDAVERFRREAVMLARLSHPRIGAIHELTRDGHDLLMVMEYVAGKTFEHVVEQENAIDLPRAVKLCGQVLDGLQYAHTAGVVHRDLKPANLIVTPKGDVKIMDFGIARMQGSEHLTSVGFMVGTPAYMSPEQVRGEEVDPRMDLYSVAVVLYRLLTRRLPFPGDTAIAMIHSQLNNPPTPPREFRADLPDWIVAVLARGLAKGRGDRFQTAEEFRSALESGLTGTLTVSGILDPQAGHTGPVLPPPGAPVATVTPPSTPAGVPVTAPLTPAGVALPLSQIAVAPVSSSDPHSGPLGVQPAPPVAAHTPPHLAAYPQVQTPGPHMVPPPRSESTVTLRAPHLATAGVLLAALVAGIAVLAVVALRPPTIVTQSPASSVAPEASAGPAASSAAPAVAAAAPANGSATAPAAAIPASTPSASPTTAAAASGTPSPAVPPASPSPSGAGSASRGNAPSTPAADPVGRGRSSAPSSAAAPASAADAPAQHFPDIRALVPEGTRAREVEALLSLEPGSVVIRAQDEGSVLRTLSYRSITAATYTRARRPRGQTIPSAAIVPENFGGAGFLGGARHWLTLQTPDEFLVLRLEDRNMARIIAAVETRTGLKVQRTEAADR